MNLEQGVILEFKDERTGELAKPVLDDLPITARGENEQFKLAISVHLGTSQRFRKNFSDERSLFLEVSRGYGCVDYFGLEKLDPERYEVSLHTFNRTHLCITDKEREFEIYIRPHSV